MRGYLFIQVTKHINFYYFQVEYKRPKRFFMEWGKGGGGHIHIAYFIKVFTGMTQQYDFLVVMIKVFECIFIGIIVSCLDIHVGFDYNIYYQVVVDVFSLCEKVLKKKQHAKYQVVE